MKNPHAANEDKIGTQSELSEKKQRRIDFERYQSGVSWFQSGVVTTGIGVGFIAAPAFAAAGSSLAVYGGWSEAGYASAAWTAALDAGVNGAFIGGANAYGMGATPWQTAQAAYTSGRNGFAGGLIAGPAFHGAGTLLGAGWRCGKSVLGATADDVAEAAARRATGIGVDAAEAIAAESIEGEIGWIGRWRLLRRVRAKHGASPKIRYNAAKDRYLIKAADEVVGPIELRTSRFGKVSRGVFYEELQHAIDDIHGLMPKPVPNPGTKTNVLFHQEVYERMLNNPLFNISRTEACDLQARTFNYLLLFRNRR